RAPGGAAPRGDRGAGRRRPVRPGRGGAGGGEVSWLLVAALAIPAIGAAAAAAVPARSDRLGRLVGTLAAALTVVVVAWLPVARTPAAPGDAAIRPWSALDVAWVPG